MNKESTVIQFDLNKNWIKFKKNANFTLQDIDDLGALLNRASLKIDELKVSRDKWMNKYSELKNNNRNKKYKGGKKTWQR